MPEGLPALASARIAGGRALPYDPSRDTALALPELAPGSCVALKIELPEEPRVLGVPYASRGPEAVVLPVGAWLWRPDRIDARFEATATLALPPGMGATVPWPRRDGEANYTLGLDAFWRPGLSGFAVAGSDALLRREIPSRVATEAPSTVEIAAGPPELLPPPEITTPWIEAAAAEVAGLAGRLRGGHVQVFLRGVPALEAVPFGQTFRGGGPVVALLVSRRLDDGEARADWVAVHELFHTLLPVMRPEDAWLFEGLATYYQNVLRGRSGRLSPRETWALLLDGFRRGAATQTGRTLADESRDMAQTHAYWSVYWGGALWALRADLALRARRPRGGGLDDAVRHWARACTDGLEPWTAGQVLAEADRALGLDGHLERSAEETLDRTDFLDLAGLDAVEWQATVLGSPPPEIGSAR